MDKLLKELEAGCVRSSERTGRDSYKESDYDFSTFVKNAVSDLKCNSSSSRFKEYVYEFPRLKTFINAVKVIYKMLIIERDFDFTHVVQKINAEVLVQENITDTNLQKALAVYEQQLRTSETLTSAFSHQEHEQKLQQAVKYLSDREAKGERLNRLIKSLTKQCSEVWRDGHQRCEAISLTGHQCVLPIHGVGGELDSDAHSTGFQLLSTCNCGRSQAIRLDPFTYKQANYDFYEHTAFECCSKGEKFDLPVFLPDTIDASENSNESENETVVSDAEMVEDHNHQELRLSKLNPLQVRILSRKTTSPRIGEEEEGEPMPNAFDADFYDNNQADYKLAENDSESSSQNEITNASNHEGTGEQTGYETASPFKSEHFVSDESEEEEEVRRQKLSQPYSTSEYDESEEAENNHDNVSTQHSHSTDHSGKKDTLLSRKKLDRKAILHTSKKAAHYLDDYDVHLTANRASDSPLPISTTLTPNKKHGEEASGEFIKARKSDLTLIKIAEKYKGQYLAHMPFNCNYACKSELIDQFTPVLPLFPSWSLISLGPSSLYNHSSGIRNQPNFKTGSEYLLPWDVRFTVNSKQWLKDMDTIAQFRVMGRSSNIGSSHRRRKKNSDEDGNPMHGSSREKVKLFVGFDYECPRGHRFMVQSPNKPLRHRRINGSVAVDAAELISSSLPIWMPCTCRREPGQLAQLMHIHVVTPKAPVTVILAPKIQMDNQKEGYFQISQNEDNGLRLGIAKYYVLRLPFAYQGPPPSEDQRKESRNFSGYLMPNCLTVVHTPLT